MMIKNICDRYRHGFRKIFGSKHTHLHWLLLVLLVSPISFLDISIDIEKKLGFASSLGTTTQITDYGITWYFKDPVEHGQYITGDYWVVGPVEVIRVTPDYIEGHHGAEVNPSNPTEQPYDDRSNKYGTSALLSIPYLANPGDSIIKTVSVDVEELGCRPCTKEASILTVVSTVPDNDAFRPSYAGGNKKEYKLSNIDWSKLPSVDVGDIQYPRYSNTDTPDYSQDGGSIPDLETTAGYFNRFWPDHLSDYQGRFIHPEDHMPDYGGDMYKQIGTALLRTMLDDPISEKEATVARLLQYAIDLEGSMISAGTRFNGNGGHTGGRKMVLTYAGILFNDTEIQNFVQNAEAHFFNEEDHNYFSPIAGSGGLVLLGDETSGSEGQYWDLLEDGAGFRTNKDLYGYIDGGPRAGDSYLIPINAALWKSDVVAMLLMPELKLVYNDQDLIDVTYRYVNHGKWTQPDPCAPFDGNINNRGVTYGPDGNGGCILDQDPSDGIGRFPDLHGTDTDAGAFSRYRVPLADRLWDTYITKGETIIDNSSSGGDSSSGGGLSSSGSGGIDFSSIGIMPVISYGQSVSVGAGGIISPDAHGPENLTWSQYIYSMNNTQDDFVSLASINDRSHDQGMLEVTVNNFLSDYGDSPKFINLRSGIGGRTIEELSIRPEHIFTTETLTQATNIVPTEYAFAMYNGENYDLYIDNGTSTPEARVTGKPEPVGYKNMISDFQNLKNIADSKGEILSDTIMFNWTQGQSNTSPVPYGYDAHLARIIDMLEADITQIYGEQVKVISMINQVSRYAFHTPGAQLKLIRDRADVHFGYPEYTYNIKYPQRTTDAVGGHLNSLGYRLMGENMGYHFYDILTQGYSENPYLESYQFDNNTSQLTLNFGGLRGSLIDDDSLVTQIWTPAQTVAGFVENVQSYFPYQLTQGGFTGIYSDITIGGYTITDEDTVVVNINNPNNRTTFPIRTGEILNGSILNSLRDSVEYDLMVPAENYGDTSAHKIRFHPYLEEITVDTSNSNTISLLANTNSSPYFDFSESDLLDTDDDTIPDSTDNCIDTPNLNQLDTDLDRSGDACDNDDDNDGILDTNENSGCELNSDTSCGVPLDTDDDTIPDSTDNCIDTPNLNQLDTDLDRSGDACDNDDDNDGILDTNENSGCELNSDTSCGVPLDTDDDTIPDSTDNCIDTPNLNQLDTDLDRSGDACDNDDDNDGILDTNENSGCELNSDTSCGVPLDTDDDTIPDSTDNCIDTPNLNQLDTDLDRSGDACDNDDDNDGILDTNENSGCELNSDTSCGVPLDTDDDTIPDSTDNCIDTPNLNQLDTDLDRSGDACDNDDDNDGILDTNENSGCELNSDTSCGVVSTGGGGGGGSSRRRDTCPEGDTSGSYYDKRCIKETDIQTTQNSQDIQGTQDTTNDESDLSFLEDELLDLSSASEEALSEEELLERLSQESSAQSSQTSSQKSQTSSQAKKGLVRIERDRNASSSQTEYRQERKYTETCSTTKDIRDYIYKLETNTDYVFTDEGSSRKRLKIRKFHALDIINGYQDGSFGPEQGVTRTEFLKILLKTHCHNYDNEDTQSLAYVDVDKNSWQARVVQRSERLGLISGDKINPLDPKPLTFRPNDFITRLEALKIIMNMSEIQVDQRLKTNYKDIRIPWHRKYVEMAETLGLLDPYLEGEIFDANAPVRREDMIDLIDNTIGLYR